ncbi:hypothetical protein C9374_013182 [Naegleria lovaniensis]|uniref:Uncharacterized protein n=1 Tax=Naegleria lovaniensis TaxID=51637 RepID=A0AA88GC08_NAELO|nr:uncharacterized protein C9374_013182 [Naegleria lovaniensis]KAG2372730.1 hypothetical protein C9374_013182 [Naegleria lovaniensis]
MLSGTRLILTDLAPNTHARSSGHLENNYSHDDEKNQSLYTKLQIKMRNFKIRNLPFAMKSEMIRGFFLDPKEQEHGITPCDIGDVVISYNLNCILVSRCNSARIVVFDLATKEFQCFLNAPRSSPRYMCIEEDNQGHDTLIIFACDQCVFKYDLQRCLENVNKVEWRKIWESDHCGWPQGIAIPRSKKSSVYVCDILSDQVVELNASNGQLLSKFRVDRAFSITFAYPSCRDQNKEYMVVTTVENNSSVQIFTQCKDDQGHCSWQSVKRIGNIGSDLGLFKNPCGVVCDNKHIIVSDCDNVRIQVFSLDNFEFIDSYEVVDKGYPYGVCLDGSSGELFVCGAESAFDG